jgi:hypothetical protein
VEVHDLWLRRRPTARVDARGRLIVQVESSRPLRGGRAAFGARIYGARGFEIVYRKTAAVQTSSAGMRAEAAYPLAALHQPKYDVNDVRARGRGVVEWRVELWDPAEKRARRFDGRTAVRCQPVPCARDATWSQLPTVRLGPFVDRVTERSAVVSFETDVATSALVWVRNGRGLDRGFASTSTGTRHEVRVEGLAPGAEHRYLVVARDGRGEVTTEASGRFFAARPKGRLRFAVMSDARGSPGGAEYDHDGVNRRVLTPLLGQAVSHGSDLVVFAGDLMTGYTTVPAYYRLQLESFLRAVEPHAGFVPIYEGIGNHEALGRAWSEGWFADAEGPPSSATAFAARVVNPENAPAAEAGVPSYRETVYSFDRSGVHFVMLDSNHHMKNRPDREDHPAEVGFREGWVSDAQLAWLEEDLSRARRRGSRHIFVFTHEPAFPCGGHAGDGMYWGGDPEVVARRDALFDILERHGVLALFTGDEHNYSRLEVDDAVREGSRGRVWQIVTGGAGAPYYAKDPTVPWADRVAAFAPRHHFVLVDVRGDRVEVSAIDLHGERFDHAVLTER